MQQEIQNSAELPGQIGRLAETKPLGAFLVSYLRQYQVHPMNVATLAVLLVGSFSFFITLIFALSGFLWWVCWLIFIVALALLWACVYGQRVSDGVFHREDQVSFFVGGFIVLEGVVATAYLWEDIEQIWRGSHDSQGQGIGDIDALRVKTRGDFFKIAENWERHARAEICDNIERNFVAIKLSQVVARYQGGEEIAFGDSLSVSKTGLRNKTGLLLWPAVERIEVGPEWISIRKEGRTSDWYHRLICDVPNAALLKALLDSK